MLRSLEALQEKALEKDAARLAARAARDAERVARLQNAKRTKAVDVTDLDVQVQEKLQLKEREKALVAMEAAHTAEVVRLRAQQDAAEAATRQALERAIQDEWRQQADANKDKNKVVLDFFDVPPEQCGRSALQKFAGEDEGRATRTKQQHADMKAWVEAQRREQAAREVAEACQRAYEATQFRQVVALAEQQEAERVACQAWVTHQVQADNAALSRQHAQAKAQAAERQRAEDQALLAHQRADPLLNEVNDCVNPETRRILPDRFRGFSTAQRHALREENHTLLTEKAAHQRHKEEKAWSARQAQYQAMLLQQEADEKEARALAQQATKATLEQQKQEHKARNQAARADAFGTIEGGKSLFAKFGSSLA